MYLLHIEIVICYLGCPLNAPNSRFHIFPICLIRVFVGKFDFGSMGGRFNEFFFSPTWRFAAIEKHGIWKYYVHSKPRNVCLYLSHVVWTV